MPWILFRHFTAELGKVILLTTAVIVTVVAFGAVIKPLAGNLLGPGGIAKYIVLAMVPMLQYALPFAVGFAGTIVTHRFASDNEVQAMSVSGLPYRTILLPQVALGLGLGLFMFVLVQTTIPRFLGYMSDVITEDASQVFVSTIRSGEPFEMGNYLISADRIALDDSRSSEGVRRVRMEGVVALEMLPGGKVGSEFVAAAGSADLYGRGSDLVIKVAFRDTSIVRPGESTVAASPLVEPMPIVIDVGWERSPKFLPWNELIEVLREPSLGALPQVERRGYEPAILPGLMMQRIERQLQAQGVAVLDSGNAGRRYEIRDAQLGGKGLVPRPPLKRIAVTELEGDQPVREASAVGASLVATKSSGQFGGGPARLDLVLLEPTARDLRGGTDRVVGWPPEVAGVAVADGAPEPTVLEALELARSLSKAKDPPLAQYARGADTVVFVIERALRSTYYEALSHIWMRFAQPVSVLLMLLLGSMLAIWKKHSLPLTIFLLAFIPSIANVILIASGQSILRQAKVGQGLSVMWAGNAALLVMIVWVGRRMARH